MRPSCLTATAVLAAFSAVAAERPVAVPGPDMRVGAGEKVVLSAAGSKGAGRALRYQWRQASGPRLKLGRRELARRDLEITPGEPGIYLFSLAVREGRLRSDPVTVRVEVPSRPSTGRGDRRPFALARDFGGVVRVGQKVALDATGSSDPDGDDLDYRWQKISGPPGEVADPAAARTEMWALGEGEYVMELTVHDGLLPSRPAVLRIQAVRKSVLPLRASRGDPLAKHVKIDLSGADLQRAVDLLPARTGVTLRVDPKLMPPSRLRTVPVSVTSEDLSVRKLCDWIARQAGAKYVVQPGGAVWLTRNYHWIHKEKLAAETYPIEQLTSSEGGGELLRSAKDLVKAALFARPDASMSLDVKKGALTAILPESAQRRARAFFSLLRTPRAAVLGAPPHSELPAKLIRSEVVCRFERTPLDGILRELSEQTGVSFGYDRAELPGRRVPIMDLALGRTSLERALDVIVSRTPFTGYLGEAPSGVWFHVGRAPLETSEHLWTAGVVSAYDLTYIVEKRHVSGPVIEHLVRQRIRPETWRDPAASITYNRATKRLIVANAACVHSEIAHFLEFVQAVGYKRFASGGAGTADAPSAEVVPLEGEGATGAGPAPEGGKK